MLYRYSIILPVYQVAPYLHQCLDSLLPQLPDDVQVIIIDDGSTDGSSKTCEQYALQYTQVELIKKTRGGVSSSRNLGLQHAQGEYLLWVDSDDWVMPNWFASIDRIISSSKPDMLIFDHMRFEKGVLLPQRYHRSAGTQNPKQVLDDIVRDIRINSALWNKAIRNTKEFRSIMQFDEALHCLEDYAVLHKLIIQMDRIEYLPELLYVYRIRHSGLVGTLNLGVAYRSFTVAIERFNDIQTYFPDQCVSPIGIVVQAKAFCRNYYIAGFPRQYLKEYRHCQITLFRHSVQILQEPDWSLRQRIRTLLSASSLAGRLYRKRLIQKGEQL